MARVVYTDRFARDVGRVGSARLIARLRLAVQRLEAFPLSSSPLVAQSLREALGAQVRKVVVSPLVLLCTYDEEADTVYLLALVHGRGIN